MAKTSQPDWTLVQFPNLNDGVDRSVSDAIQLLFKGLKDHSDAFTSLKSQLTGLQAAATTPVSSTITGVSSGGTGSQSLANNGVLIGQGSNPIQAVSPSQAGYVLSSNGATTNPSFQSPVISELLVDQNGNPILAEFSTGTFDIIMVVHHL